MFKAQFHKLKIPQNVYSNKPHKWCYEVLLGKQRTKMQSEKLQGSRTRVATMHNPMHEQTINYTYHKGKG